MEQTETAPGTQPSAVDQIRELLNETADVEPVQSQSEDAGSEVQELDAGGDDSSGGGVDESEHASDASVLEDTESGEAEADDAALDEVPVNLKELASHLEMDAADLYEVEVPISKDESVTLGQLKDAYKEYGAVHEYKEKVSKQEDDLERELLATRAHLNRILPLIPQENAQAIIAQASESTRHWDKQQEELVLETIPEWKDATTRAADRQGIVEQLAGYGFTQAEVEYTKDARMQRYMRDMYALKREVEEMRTASKKQVSSAAAPGKRSTMNNKQRKLAQQLRRAKESNNRSDKAAMIGKLLRG